MTEATAPQAGGEATPSPAPEVFTHVPAKESLSVSEAARSYSDARYKAEAEARRQAEAPPAAAEPEKELSIEDNAAPPEEATGENADTDPADDQPSIDPPRSWTKEEKEEFRTYPREAQEKIARREQERDAAIRRSQNEAAEKLKGLTAKEQQAEQLRQQYESALPVLLQTLQASQAGEFSDIRTIQDVERMAREDWPRYIQWDASQKKIAAVQQEVLASQQRSTVEKQQQFSAFAREQDAKFAEAVTEFADPDKASKLQKQTVDYLKNIGFTDEELAKGWNERDSVSLRDARMQQVLLDAARFKAAQAQTKKVLSQPKPPVPAQKPGTGKQVTGLSEQIANLESQLSKATGLKALRLATELQSMKRRAG